MRDPDAVWFRLPPGYVDLDLDALEPLRDGLLADWATLCADPDRAARAARESRALFGVLEQLRDRGVLHTAIGLHAGDGTREGGAPGREARDEARVSVFSLSEVETGAPSSAAAAARCALDLATAGLGDVWESGLVDLPCGTPAALVTSLLPGRPDGVDGPVPRAFQARLAIARPRGSRVVVADLTTAHPAEAAAYTDILLAVGGTVRFTEPEGPAEPDTAPARSRLLDVLL
ncbi:hypothetical protein EAO71_05200 [Streptomyces sp. ms191]|uniref:hypothetical protein n=1 Tax=Streptomyces sp. ms191 TaxID=1827978 RepID=UPI0011CE80AD|nr:hypothetical protein [Streptomyces sp. ms191]TXS32248.1 hypothetical protein EAO71_05200 [Streptomyces sp. ms191]